VEHRREQEEVVAVDQGDLDARVAGQRLLEFEGGVEAAETAAGMRMRLGFAMVLCVVSSEGRIGDPG
jgi:hypothetical protein